MHGRPSSIMGPHHPLRRRVNHHPEGGMILGYPVSLGCCFLLPSCSSSIILMFCRVASGYTARPALSFAEAVVRFEAVRTARNSAPHSKSYYFFLVSKIIQKGTRWRIKKCDKGGANICCEDGSGEGKGTEKNPSTTPSNIRPKSVIIRMQNADDNPHSDRAENELSTGKSLSKCVHYFFSYFVH